MPSGDRTGPLGQGPLTGRGFGFCTGYRNNNIRVSRGSRRRFFATGIPGWKWFGYQGQFNTYGKGAPFQGAGEQYSAEEEKEILKAETEVLKNQLDRINERLNQLEEKTDE